MNIVFPVYSIRRGSVLLALLVYPVVWLPIIVFEIYSIYSSFSHTFTTVIYYLLIAPSFGSEIIYVTTRTNPAIPW